MPKLPFEIASVLAARFCELEVTYRLKLLTVAPPMLNGWYVIAELVLMATITILDPLLYAVVYTPGVGLAVQEILL